MDHIVEIRYNTAGMLQYRTNSSSWITVGHEGGVVVPPVVISPVIPPVVTPPVVVPTGAYSSTDTEPRLIPPAWLIPHLHGAPYLLGKGWWLLQELAKAAQMNLTVLQGCPLSVEYAGSPAHRPCIEIGGGLMADVQYPSVNGKLDVVSMKLIVQRFLDLTCALIPGKEYLDIANESEIRVGSDVQKLIGISNRHVQVDDSQHHRFDDTLFPHFHLKWHIYR